MATTFWAKKDIQQNLWFQSDFEHHLLKNPSHTHPRQTSLYNPAD